MKKLLFCAAMMLLLGMQALPVNAAAAAHPFVRWSVYSAAAGNENALRAAVAALNTALQNSEGMLAVYGGEDENGVIRYLEIYTDKNAFNAAQNNASVKTAAAQAFKLAQVHKTLAADAFNLQSKTTGTADKARMALLATTETARPNVFHLLELYADDNAYRAHIDGPYCQEYNKAVQTMVTDKVLIVNKPQAVMLSGKNLK